MEGGHVHACLEQRIAIAFREVPGPGAVDDQAYGHSRQRPVAERVVEALARGVALEDVRLEQDLPARAEDGGEHGRIGFGAVHQDGQAVPGFQLVRGEAVPFAGRRSVRRLRLHGMRILHRGSRPRQPEVPA